MKKTKLPEVDWVLNVLMEIDVPIFTAFNDHYIAFISDLDVCNDGSGPAHGDPHHQSQTAYYNGGKYLNADKDRYIVSPPQVRDDIDPVVLGCLGRVTNLATSAFELGVVGEIGPDDKTGEAAYCLAKILNPKITHNTGDKSRIYLYEFWPDVPAPGYKLQPS
jgi:hypothetical protein